MPSNTPAADYAINQHDHSSRKPAECPPQAGERERFKSATLRFSDTLFEMIDGPVTWFREKIVTPNQKNYPWYHQQLRRVPTIDQCYVDDEICIYEANEQFKRDRAVDSSILNILRYRMDDCVREEYPDIDMCFPLKETYEKAAEAWYVKYGELGAQYHVRQAFMKQKHRLLWERRHGKVGCGMRKDNELSAEPEDH